jgi:hypothetical protein
MFIILLIEVRLHKPKAYLLYWVKSYVKLFYNNKIFSSKFDKI